MGIFGRADDLRRLEAALKTVGLHPRLAPDAVKIAAVREMRRDPDQDGGVSDAQCAATALLLTYCMIGPDGLAAEVSDDAVELVEKRVEQAIVDGDTLDARIILLALHAGILHPAVIDHFGLESEGG